MKVKLYGYIPSTLFYELLHFLSRYVFELSTDNIGTSTKCALGLLLYHITSRHSFQFSVPSFGLVISCILPLVTFLVSNTWGEVFLWLVDYQLLDLVLLLLTNLFLTLNAITYTLVRTMLTYI